MRPRSRVHGSATAATAVMAIGLVLGCGTEEPKSTNVDGTSERYLPLAIGNTWSYRVTDLDSGETHVKTQTVEALEPVEGKPGVEAFRMTTESGAEITVSWQQDIDVAIVRHGEESFDASGNLVVSESYAPHKLRVDEHTSRTEAGATYSQTYTETHTDVTLGTTTEVAKEEQWLVEATDEAVTVPAGTFSCLRLKRTGATTDVVKTYFFARGVGKVKEMGGQTEELIDHELTGP